MSTLITKEASFIEARKQRVAKIVEKHSRELFGYSHASVREIRNEAIKRRLEAIYNA